MRAARKAGGRGATQSRSKRADREYPTEKVSQAWKGRNETNIGLHRQHHRNLMLLPALYVPYALKGRNGLRGHGVLCAMRATGKGEVDVPYEIRWLEHRREMRDREALVRRDGAQELVRRDVVDVDVPCCGPCEKQCRSA